MHMYYALYIARNGRSNAIVRVEYVMYTCHVIMLCSFIFYFADAFISN